MLQGRDHVDTALSGFGSNFIIGQTRDLVSIAPQLWMLAAGAWQQIIAFDRQRSVYQQRTVKHEKTTEEQKAKIERGAQCSCTEGISGEYQIYINAAKQRHKMDISHVDELGEDSEDDDTDNEWLHYMLFTFHK